MSRDNKALGIIGVWRIEGWTRRQIYEALYFTSNKVIVIRTATGFHMGWGAIDSAVGWQSAENQEESMERLSIEEVEKLRDSDEKNLVISYNQIQKIELKSFFKAALIYITVNGKRYKWSVRGVPHVKNATVFDVEKILEPIFGDKLIKSKIF